MSPEQVISRIEAVLPGAQVVMKGEDCHFGVEVTASQFVGKSPLQRHRMVNDAFKQEFESGELHALSIKTQVPL